LAFISHGYHESPRGELFLKHSVYGVQLILAKSKSVAVNSESVEASLKSVEVSICATLHYVPENETRVMLNILYSCKYIAVTLGGGCSGPVGRVSDS